MGLVLGIRESNENDETTSTYIQQAQIQDTILISSKPLNDHGSIDIEVYLIDLESYTFNSLSKPSTAIQCWKCSSHEVLSGTELMGESYCELFRDFFLNTILAGYGGICMIATRQMTLHWRTCLVS